MPSLRFAVVGVFLLGVLTRLTGVVREIIVASEFGASHQLDQALLAISIPIACAVAAGGGLARAAVPVAAGMSPRQLGGFFQIAGRRVLTLGAIASGLLFITSPLWARLLRPGASAEDIAWLVKGGALASLGLAGGCLAGLCVGLTNARGRHISASLNPILYNFVIIGALLVLAPSMGAFALIAGIVMAEWSQLILLLPPLARLVERAVPRGIQGRLRQLGEAMVPATLLGLAGGLNTVVDRYFAGQLSDGAVSALSYADRLLYLPIGLIGMALATPLYTRLAHYARAKNAEGFESTMLLGLCASVALGVPLAAFSWGLAEPGIALLLWRGAFEAGDVVTSAQALRGYAPAIVFLSMLPLAQSAAFAQGHHWRGVLIAIGGVTLNAVLNRLLIGPFGLQGIAYATSISSALCVITLLMTTTPLVMQRRILWQVTGRALATGLGIALVLLGLGAAAGDAWRAGWMAQVVSLLTGIMIPVLAFAFFARPMWAPLVPKIRALRHRVARAATQEVPLA